MHFAFPKSLKTPLPLIPLFIAATAIGTAASLAGLGLQGAQHYEYTKQLPEQKKLLAYQLKLAEHQLQEFEEAKKAKNMFNMARNVPVIRQPPPPPMAITTRSMACIGTLGTQLMPSENFQGRDVAVPHRGFVNPAYRATPPPALSVPNYSPLSAHRVVAPPVPLREFENRATPLAVRNPINYSPMSARRAAVGLQSTPLVVRAQQDIEMPNLQPNIPSPPMGRVTSIRRLQNRFAPPRVVPQVIEPVRAYDTAAASITRAVRMRRGRYNYDRMDELPLGMNRLRRPNLLARGRAFLNKHKRKIIAAGVIGGAALITGLSAGLSTTTTTQEMREGNTGKLGQIIRGGGAVGGGGGGGGYAGYGRPPIRRKKRVGKKRVEKKQRKNKSTKRLKNGKGINKKQKKSRKSKKRFAAF